MKTYVYGLITLSLLLGTGCAQQEDAIPSESEEKAQEQKNVGYVSSKNPKDLPEDYNPTNVADDEKYLNRNTPLSDPDADSYNNKEYDKQSRDIAKRLTQSRYVKTAQVVVTHESVVVAVEEPDRATYTRVNVAKMVRNALREMPETDGKEIVVYTDERYWDRKKDLRSRINQDKEMPEEVDQFQNDYR